MGLIRVSTMLSVVDLQRTIAFYRDALGFTLTGSFEREGATVWANLSQGAVQMMFNQVPDSWVEQRDRAARMFQIYYLYPSSEADLLRLHEKLVEQSRQVSALRVTFYGMREFELRDPDHYWLWFGSPTDAAPTGERLGAATSNGGLPYTV